MPPQFHNLDGHILVVSIVGTLTLTILGKFRKDSRHLIVSGDVATSLLVPWDNVELCEFYDTPGYTRATAYFRYIGVDNE